MVTRDDLESYMIRMDLDFNEVDEGMYVVQGPSGAPVVVHHSPPLLVIRMKVMRLPEEKDLGALYKALLVWNAADVVHGAYGIEERDLILTDTLQLETLDYPELQGSVESIQMAASSHMEKIQELCGTGEES